MAYTRELNFEEKIVILLIGHYKQYGKSLLPASIDRAVMLDLRDKGGYLSKHSDCQSPVPIAKLTFDGWAEFRRINSNSMSYAENILQDLYNSR